MEGVDWDEVHRRVAATVWCTFATVDTRGRATTRIVHPVWDGTTCWIASRATTPKVRHVEQHPGVSLLWWDPTHRQVTVDGTATVHRDAGTKAHVWEVVQAPPPPYGWDPGTIFPSADDDGWVAIRVVPRRVLLAAH